MIHGDGQVKAIQGVIDTLREELAYRYRDSVSSPYEYRILQEAEDLFLEAGKCYRDGNLAGSDDAGAKAMQYIERMSEERFANYKESIRSILAL